MTRAKDISKIVTDADLSGTLDVAGEVNLSANLNLGDNDKAIFGAGSDLQIYHDGNNSYIDEQGTGNIKYRAASRHQFENTDSSKIYMQLVGDTVGQEFVQLRYNNATKLATTATGIEVTDTVNNTPTINIKSSDTVVVADDVVGAITFEESDATGGTGVQAFIKAIANDSGNTYDMSIGVGGNTEAIRIDQSGNVGIGTSPSDILHIKDASSTNVIIDAPTDNASLTLQCGSSDAGAEGAFVNFIQNTTSKWQMGMNTDNTFRWYNYNTSSEAMRIDSSGNVGIGTSTALSGSSSVTALRIGNQINIYEYDDGSNPVQMNINQNIDASENYIVTDQASRYQMRNGVHKWFSVASGTAGTASGIGSGEKMQLDASGNLLVNTTNTSPHADGSGIAIRSADGVLIGVDSTHAIIAARHGTDGEVIRIQNGTSDVGSIDVSGSSTSYNTTSDHRLKENVTADWDATTRLKQLNPVRFNFIADADTTVDGFLAHEVQDIVPEAISGEKDAVDDEGNPDYQGIDQSKLVPLLTKAIQEQQTIIDDLKTRIETLENA